MARLTGTVTQGAADAYAEAEVQTALQGQTQQAYKIAAIDYEFETTAILGGGSSCDVEFSLSRRSKTAMPSITDVDVIKKWHWGSLTATVVGQYEQPPLTGRWVPELDTIIVEDPLFLQIDSTATGFTATGLCVITYEIVRISDVDRLTLLTQSLV